MNVAEILNRCLKEGLPGQRIHSPMVQDKLKNAYLSRYPAQGQPRTRHFSTDGVARYHNLLLLQNSPYLLQHAHNPVDWQPWSPAAFEQAKRENKAIFLSVGYSTCHWCHVMEEESFEDEEIAAFINSHFVAIKVDREERPDVDTLYMAAVQAISGQGGWPMSVFMDSHGRPFFAGTYFPARDGDRGMRMGFLSILKKISSAYQEDYARVDQSAGQITHWLKEQLEGTQAKNQDLQSEWPRIEEERWLERYYKMLQGHFDGDWGGLSGAPKFPSSFSCRFLLRYALPNPASQARAMAETTLNKMAQGGLMDQLAGGFHRYSVDAQWTVPHFEKMLYDQALLVLDYLEAFRLSRKNEYAEIAIQTLDFVLREFCSEHACFYSASDADSLGPSGHREEGYYYTWTADEIRQALGADHAAAELAIAYWGVTDAGNFEDSGRSVLENRGDLEQWARQFSLNPSQVKTHIQEIRQKLLKARQLRPAPSLDKKIITSWNALMISSLSRAALLLEDADLRQRYGDAALQAGQSLFNASSYRPSHGPGLRIKRLAHWSQGDISSVEGFLEDYSFLIAAFLDLFSYSGDPQWYVRALELQKTIDESFVHSQGGYYATSSHHEALLAREKPLHDGAIPSGNSVAAMNLLRFYQINHEHDFQEKFLRLCHSIIGPETGRLASPLSLSELLLTWQIYQRGAYRLLILASEASDAEAFLSVWRRSGREEHFLCIEKPAAWQNQSPPWQGFSLANQGQKSQAILCNDQHCLSPFYEPAQLEDALKSL